MNYFQRIGHIRAARIAFRGVLQPISDDIVDEAIKNILGVNLRDFWLSFAKDGETAEFAGAMTAIVCMDYIIETMPFEVRQALLNDVVVGAKGNAALNSFLTCCDNMKRIEPRAYKSFTYRFLGGLQGLTGDALTEYAARMALSDVGINI